MRWRTLAGALSLVVAGSGAVACGAGERSTAPAPEGPAAVVVSRPVAPGDSGPVRSVRPDLGQVPGQVLEQFAKQGRVVRPVSTTPVRLARPAQRLVIGSVGIVARVVPVWFVGRRLQIPAAVSAVGFWTDGARLGDAVGRTVLVGHVSDNSDRPGVMGRIRRLEHGAEVRVRAGGRAHRFRVVRIRSYAKAGLPRSVFSQTGPHRLVLITCSQRVATAGGGFHYVRNLVVEAVPVGG